MNTKLQLPTEYSFLRMAAQCLAPSLRKTQPEDVVTHMLAMQGQQVYSFPHAVLVRTDFADFATVQRAFERHQLVRHRPMRGTVHITHARDYHWMRLALNHSPGNWVSRHESRAGMTDAIFAEAAAVAREKLKEQAEEAGLRRRDLFALWAAHFSSIIPAEVGAHQFARLLMWGLDRRGALIEGPLRHHEHLFIDAAAFPAADSADSGFCFHADMPREHALTELARRYIRGHGPASVADLARWASLKKAEARQALEENVRRGILIHCRIGEQGAVPLARRLGSSEEAFYIEETLPSVVHECREELRELLFLPAFDELHVGYGNRTCLTDAAGEALICPAKNGMFRPILIEKGRLVAVLSGKEGVSWLRKPSAAQQKRAAAAMEGIRRRMERPPEKKRRESSESGA